MNRTTLFLLLLFIYSKGFTQKNIENKKEIYSNKGVLKHKATLPTADKQWGQLFTDVQMSMALGDNKTFTDAVPKHSTAFILKKYASLKLTVSDTAKIKEFVYDNFYVPAGSNTQINTINKEVSLKKHLEDLWPTLVRKSDEINPASSLLPLPKEYVVPGGRFREIYYWDSYFTMLGLAVSNRYDLIENMLDNFKYLIDTYGHIPNGNRNYYLGRSQPPYFALMVELLHEKKGKEIYKKYYTALQKEYKWWMDGAANLTPNKTYRRVCKMPNGSILNRYFDDVNAPRQESYMQDVETAKQYIRNDKKVFTNLRAGAESGWDFSSRWFADTMHINTIETTDIIPVDLNCLLYAYEKILSQAAAESGFIATSKTYKNLAESRKKAILTFCWNKDENFFFDYHFKKQSTTNRFSLAGVMPLFVQIATKEQSGYIKEKIEQLFLKDGGVTTTPYHTHQQWDAPNGWAPLQYITIKGLSNYNYNNTAQIIANRWMAVNETVFANTGKMLEKYNVENIHLPSGGGEYPTQDGFGWSNGVYLKLYSMYR